MSVISYTFRRLRIGSLCLMAVAFFALAGAGCSKSDTSKIPDNFKFLSTSDQMEYLMDRLPADSVAVFICNASMGKVYNARIELQPAISYAYEKYGEDDLVRFQMALEQYKDSLPLHEKIRITKLIGVEDPDQYAYDFGLSYVGDIRVEQKDIKQISDELASLRKECGADPEFYTRFMKGFKTALRYDRHHDLDDAIYLKFINYPDNLN